MHRASLEASAPSCPWEPAHGSHGYAAERLSEQVRALDAMFLQGQGAGSLIRGLALPHDDRGAGHPESRCIGRLLQDGVRDPGPLASTHA